MGHLGEGRGEDRLDRQELQRGEEFFFLIPAALVYNALMRGSCTLMIVSIMISKMMIAGLYRRLIFAPIPKSVGVLPVLISLYAFLLAAFAMVVR